MKTDRLSNGKIWGFAFGTVGEYFVYFLFAYYFIYYLTDYAKISPAIAGTIFMIAVVWDALTDPVVGFINDKSTNPKGRRRPMMLKAYIPFVATFLLCFIRPTVAVGPGLYVYYTLVALAFWWCFTCEQVPFYGLLPEIARHEDDRMKIRQAMAVWGTTGNITIGIVPIALEFVINAGVDEVTAWAVTMGILGAIGGTSFLVSYLFSKDCETKPENVARPDGGIIKTYKTIVCYKGYIPVVLTYLLCTVFINIIFACIIYISANKLGLSAMQQSVIMWCYTFAGVVFTPLITIMNKKWGSVLSFNITVVITIIAYLICGFIGLNSMAVMVFHGVLTAAAFVLFTAFQYGMFYQVIDVAYLRDGQQVEGSVISFATLGYKIGAAISGFSVGVALSIIGYDGSDEVSQSVLGKLDSLLTFIPVVLIIVCFLLIKFLYPIKQKTYEKILEEKRKKEEGLPYSIDYDAFKKIM
jgi:Na+/melibiose symporter-like transporter